MNSAPKCILVVAHDRTLRATRVMLLEKEGYRVESAEEDNHAMERLETERFDLILLGRNSQMPAKGLDQRLREQYPNLVILKIEATNDIHSLYPSRTTDPLPEHVLMALKEMLS